MNILVFTKNWLGDVIFETPAIRAIKENFPDSRLIAVTPPRCYDLLKSNPYVDEVIPLNHSGSLIHIPSKLRLVRDLRQRGIDYAFLFHRSQDHACMAYLSGAKNRIGYKNKYRQYFLTHPFDEPEGPIHDVQYFLNLVSSAGFQVKGDYHYEFYFSKEDELEADRLIHEHNLQGKTLVAINPGANWIPKRWPPLYFKELAKRLIESFGAHVLVIGGTEDQKITDLIVSDGDPDIVSLNGKTSLGVLGAIYSKCRLVISNDTGPLHIAAAVGANVVALFGPTQSLETGPLGRGRNIIIHYIKEGFTQDQLPWIGKNFPAPWMELIPVDLVIRTIEKEKLLER